ncbi:hypothetical protein [Mitsuaria sp. 7]|uniref:hypothetical protein n=1 Tax=Mitsuaria sp. 7 TaxID=1658665 RepID=UPI0007DD018E|nr:hypothetical protein [Mitsuaria sp. 7]ANH68292.1 hypothetical protein ABE85_13260 [Mitsuaria sp. 7]
MTLLIRELERIDTRVLGALRCIDATTRVQVGTPLEVRVEGATVRRNRSGLYVIVRAEAPLALAAHEAAFDNAPATPTVGDVTLFVTVSDPAGRYLPRRASLALPRDPQPGNAASPESLFRPVELPLYPSAIAPTGMNWSVLRLSVHETGTLDALGGALLLVRAGGNVLARALTDWRGEALLPVPGVPVTTWSDDPDEVVVTELAARIEWCFDPAPAAAGTRTSAAQVRAGRAPAVLPLVDPDELESRAAALPVPAVPLATLDVALAAGRTQSFSLPLALP